MEKIKLNIEVLKETNKKTVMIGDQEIEIMEHISCEEREAMATEYAALAIVIDEEKEMAFRNVGDYIIKHWLMCKYYTNIDMSQFKGDMETFYDLTWAYNQSIKKVCIEDYSISDFECESYLCMAINNYNKEHSIGHKLMLSLNGIINGEDIMKRLAESKLVNEEMIDLIERAGKTEKSNVVFPGFAKKSE